MRHQFGVERDIDSHFAVVFEISLALVKNLDRVADQLRTWQRWVAEIGKGYQGDAGFMAHLAGDGGRLLGNVG